jgi:hypothetical protein
MRGEALLALPAPYPWKETSFCRGEYGDGHGALYTVDYRQDRDWSRCPQCTGEAGKRCLRIFHVQEKRWYEWNEAAQEYLPHGEPVRG